MTACQDVKALSFKMLETTRTCLSALRRPKRHDSSNRSAKITRREIALALSGSTALLAQTPNPPAPQSPEDELGAARNLIRQNAEQLAKFPLPMSTEPAVHFKA
jgi:hypothetical protein